MQKLGSNEASNACVCVCDINVALFLKQNKPMSAVYNCRWCSSQFLFSIMPLHNPSVQFLDTVGEKVRVGIDEGRESY